MSFSASSITEVFPPVYRRTEVFLSWSATAPPGTWYQVYVGTALVWAGQRTWCWVALPDGPSPLAIGTVAAGEETTSFASSLAPAPQRRATLSWQGGTYLGATLAGFRVYSGSTPGAAVGYTTPVATITAYPAGITADGFGLSGYGQGSFGLAASTYSWTSAPLSSGPWNLAIVPFDAAGNGGTAATAAVTIVAPPRPPGCFPGTTIRLRYRLSGYGQGGFGATAPPGYGGAVGTLPPGVAPPDAPAGRPESAGAFGLSSLTLTWNPPPS